VSIERHGHSLELTVTDDGRGFDVESVRRARRGLGLVSVEERAHGAGGEALITSVEGQGSSVIVRVPCAGTFMKPGDGDAEEAVADRAASSVEPWIAESL
jgi:signal transduction histidine kinase